MWKTAQSSAILSLGRFAGPCPKRQKDSGSPKGNIAKQDG